jgi:EAL domain-containing protein (putative c-di-GMP-specific phosphodiesterase class I)
MSLRDLTTEDTSLFELVERGALTSLFQPIVRLGSGAAVAYEALIRGPKGSPLELPAAIFHAARREGLTGVLEAACHRAALEGGRRLGLGAEDTLFVNVEPRCIAETDVLYGQQISDARIVLEISERNAMARPAELLRAVDCARERGWGVALDDVGVDDESLALLPILQPDVVKLDRSVVAAGPTTSTVRLLSAIWGASERWGAHILAEGIECLEHEQFALELGARYGQGWLYGRPAPAIDPQATREQFPLREPQPRPQFATSPFRHAVRRAAPSTASRELITTIAVEVGRHANECGGPAVVLGVFPRADRFHGHVAPHLEALAQRCTLVAAVGPGLSEEPAAGVRGGALESDAWDGELHFLVLTPTSGIALLAREVEQDGGVTADRYSYLLTHDRAFVAECAELIVRRLAR